MLGRVPARPRTPSNGVGSPALLKVDSTGQRGPSAILRVTAWACRPLLSLSGQCTLALCVLWVLYLIRVEARALWPVVFILLLFSLCGRKLWGPQPSPGPPQLPCRDSRVRHAVACGPLPRSPWLARSRRSFPPQPGRKPLPHYQCKAVGLCKPTSFMCCVCANRTAQSSDFRCPALCCLRYSGS